jgi:hypothetical protein
MKGQSSLEFLVGVMALLLIYVVVLGSFKSIINVGMVDNEMAKQLCYTVSSGIDSANIGGNGFTINVTLPKLVNSKYEYNLTVLNKSLIDISWDQKLFACSIVNQNITKKVLHSGGKISMSNIAGYIHLSSVEVDKREYTPSENVNIEGEYFNGTVRLIILNSDGSAVSGYPKDITSDNGVFKENWTSSVKGIYTISAYSLNNTRFMGQTEVDVV